MKFPKNKVFIALIIAGSVVLLWFLYRENSTSNLDAELAFDFGNYLNSVTDTTEWDKYEPLSLEIPE